MNGVPKRGLKTILPWLAPLPLVLWIAALLAMAFVPGVKLDGLMDNLTQVFQSPLAVRWTERTAAFLLTAVLVYAVALAMYHSSQMNTRPGEEYGSAKWGDAKSTGARYRDRKDPEANITVTQHVCMALNTRLHQRNLNFLVIGGAGAGKSRTFCQPGVMDANCSYIVCDPKGETLRNTGHLLESLGYDIKVFDLINMELSDSFNPLAYVRSDKDVLRLITSLIKNTTPRTAQSQDPFWDKAETALLSALLLFLYHEAPRNEFNFSTVMYMLENAAASEDNEDHRSPIDLVFEALENEEPEHIAVKQYKVFKQAAGKTLKSILVAASVRLAMFNLEEVQRITNRDDMDLGTLGEQKRAVFLLIPDNDTTFNYLCGMFYSAAVQELYYRADYHHGGSLPRHVRFIQDEWANVALPDDYEKILSTARSRNLGFSIVVQNIAQIKGLYEKTWENITGNCDHMLYLGGNEQGSHEYLAKSLGKANVRTKTTGITRGRSGSSSENHQQTGRELLMADEIRMLDNRYALLFIRGERPIIDRKFDIKSHPNYKLTGEGGAGPYKRAPSYEQTDLYAPYESVEDVEFLDE